MEEEKINSKKRIILISSITIIALILVVGISYALWQQTRVQEGTNYIASGCFGVEFVGNNPINLTNSFPIPTEEGMNDQPYTFTITNTCNSKAAYDVNLEALSNTTFNSTSIRVALDETNKLYSEYTEAEPYYETSIESRKLISGRLEASESVTYNLRLWVDEAVTNEEQNKMFASKIVVNASEDFDDPEIIDINATSTINSISITYNANGDISTTCKWGIEVGTYDNEVADATNTNCNIGSLSENTTYYYQICTETGKGNKCVDGVVRTKLTPTITSINEIKVGDYISMIPTSTSYTPLGEDTGCLNDEICTQNTINPSELNLWRVIKKNDDGTVEAVSEYVSSTDVYFYGKEGYINFVGTLNKIAAQYTNSKYVERTRHIGYSNQTEKITDTSKLSLTTASPWGEKETLKYRGKWSTECDPSEYLCGIDENLGAGDIGYEIDYNLVNGVYGTMEANNPSGSSSDYFISSRYFEGNTSEWNIHVGMAIADRLFNQAVYRYIFDIPLDYPYPPDFSVVFNSAVRPIVTIKANVQVVSGDGQSEATAYAFE